MKLAKNSLIRNLILVTAILALEILISAPAFAHHPMGGKTPASFFEGILSGLGHPVIGLDHFAFVVASGLMAVGIARGLLIPVTFVVATAVGTGMHLQRIDLPFPEIVIASSVILFGILLVINQKKRKSLVYTAIIPLAAIAGIFHGHAYGEGIFGAEPTPLVAYLLGFTAIQLAISISSYQIARQISFKYLINFLGFAIAAIGLTFFTSAIMNQLS